MKPTAKKLLRNALDENMQVINWTLYDSVLTTAAVTQTLTLFLNTIGSVGIGRTNMPSAGMLPSPKTFLCFGLSFKFLNTAGTPFFQAGGAAPSVHPVNALMGAFTFSFTIDPVTVYEGHGSQFWDQKDYQNDTGAVLAVEQTPKSYWKTLKFDNPLVLPSARSFKINVQLTAPAAAGGYTAAGTPLYCFLYGFLRRNK